MPMSQPDFVGVKTQEFVIQPTAFCNLNCAYCNLPYRSSQERMDMQTVSRIFERIFSSSLVADRVHIVWHSGEPMTIPIRFYEEAYQLMEQWNTHHISATFIFQTNGTCITQEHCDFMKAHQARIRISLDGLQSIHDANRMDRAGKGTFERVMRGIDLLQKNGIDPTILMVLTRQAFDYPDAIWQFFIDHRIKNIAFLVEQALGTCNVIPLNAPEDGERYKEFLQRILVLRDACLNPPFVREIDPLIYYIKHLTQPVWARANTPLAVVSIDRNGYVSTLSPELLTYRYPHGKTFIFGNVFENSLEDILSHPQFITINREVQEGVASCKRTCEYFVFCGGGSPANKCSESGTFDTTETAHCKLKIKAATDVILAHLEKQYQEKGV